MDFEALLDRAKQGDEQAAAALRRMELREEDISRLNEELVESAADNDTAAVGALLAAGADPKVRDEDGRTLLWDVLDITREYIEQPVAAIRLLLAAGAPPNALDKDGDTVLDFYLGGREVADELCELLRAALERAGRDEEAPAEVRLLQAAKHGDAEWIGELTRSGARADVRNSFGETALMFAAKHRDPGAVGALLAAGADMNARDRWGGTALRRAARRGHAEAVELLLAAGADDVDAKDGDGETVLLKAARFGFADVVKALLSVGADATLKDPEGRTAAFYAEAWITPAPCPFAPPSGEARAFTNSIGMVFAPIPAGTFLMGSADDDGNADADEKPRHEVTISRAFHLGVYPVTQAQWRAVMGENPSVFKGPDRPVECVSWEDAQAFIARLNAAESHGRYRLPTEAEWEYACRAGGDTFYSFGDDEDEAGDYAWHCRNSGDKTHPVGQKRPNAWGLYDMHGNVWEWALDWRGAYEAGAAVDPRGPETGKRRVLRGGCWAFAPGYGGSACRYGYEPESRSAGFGFRLALAPED